MTYLVFGLMLILGAYAVDGALTLVMGKSVDRWRERG